MVDYVMNFHSYHPHTLNIIKDVFSAQSLQSKIFPFKFFVEPSISDKTIIINSLNDFNIELISSDFSSETVTSVQFYSENGVELRCTIYSDSSMVSPNTFSIKFSTSHLQEEILDLEAIRSILFEVIPIFKSHSAGVYDRKSDQRRNMYPQRGFYKYKGLTYVVLVHWIKFFGAEMIEFLGRERFAKLQTFEDKYDVYGGVLIILQKEPFDGSKAEHCERERRAMVELQLESVLNDA
jgi:hypothetical protein